LTVLHFDIDSKVNLEETSLTVDLELSQTLQATDKLKLIVPSTYEVFPDASKLAVEPDVLLVEKSVEDE